MTLSPLEKPLIKGATTEVVSATAGALPN